MRRDICEKCGKTGLKNYRAQNAHKRFCKRATKRVGKHHTLKLNTTAKAFAYGRVPKTALNDTRAAVLGRISLNESAIENANAEILRCKSVLESLDILDEVLA